MIQDVAAVMWKEYREVFAQRGSRAVALFVIPIFLMGVFLPWQTGASWLNTPTTMLIWAWLPAFLVVAIIVDSFAGERERHTLETLLASRLPDRAILLGKIGVSVLYSWSMTLAGMALALVTVNLTCGGSGFLMYSADVLLVGVVLSALVSVMVATVGTLISLRAATVRQAQQIISILLLVPWFGIMFGMQLIPADLKASIVASLGNLSIGDSLILLEVAVAVIDAGLLVFAVTRFNRAKLAFN